MRAYTRFTTLAEDCMFSVASKCSSYSPNSILCGNEQRAAEY
jgi:hypothetical protein